VSGGNRQTAGTKLSDFETANRATLWILALAMFVIGTASLSVLGVGADMTRALQVSPGAAGWLMTLFALAFAAAAPAVQLLLADRMSARLLILAGLTLLALAQFWAGAATTFAGLLGARAAAALGGALVAPTAAALAIALVPETRRGAALATVFAGFTLATVLGVPLMTWLAHAFGWRGAMVALGLLAAAVLAAAAGAVPKTGGSRPVGVNDRHAPARLAAPAAALVTTLAFLGAQFAVYALMAEMLVKGFGLANEALPLALLAFGIGGVAGNAAAGLLTDRLGSATVVWISMAGLAVLLLFLTVGLHPLGATAVVSGCAFAGTLFTAPQQVRLAGLVAPERHGLALALNSSASYLGIGLGSAAASLLYESFGLTMLPTAGLVLLVLAGLANGTVSKAAAP
jgi:MFS transporter, DHA1 family, inner membrane transport protein